MVEDMGDRTVADRLVRDAEKTQQQDVLGRHRDVGLELVGPPAVRMLMLQQPLDGAAQMLRNFLPSSRTRAAARPLRTADSIVSGQPVAVQAPATARLGSVVRAEGRGEPGFAK